MAFGWDDALSIGGSLLGGALGSSASKKAAEQQAAAALNAAYQSSNAANQSNTLQKYMYDTSRSDLSPWRSAGTAAVGRLSEMLGIAPQKEYSVADLVGPDRARADAIEAEMSQLNSLINGPVKPNASSPGGATAITMIPIYQKRLAELQAELKNLVSRYAGSQPAQEVKPYSFQTSDPSYQWRLEQGQQALERSAAARGGLMSGRNLKDLTDYGQGAASQEFQNEFSRLGTIAGYGQNATNSGINAGQNYATNVGNTLSNNAANMGNANLAAANATASGYLGSNNAWGSAIGNIFSPTNTKKWFGD